MTHENNCEESPIIGTAASSLCGSPAKVFCSKGQAVLKLQKNKKKTTTTRK